MKYGYNTILLSIASFSFLLTWSFVKHCWTYGQSKWHAVASWTWDAQDETCGICRMAFDGCCPDCKLPGDDCPLTIVKLHYMSKMSNNMFCLAVWGACNHAFHLHCILKWVTSQTPQAHCPMCRREWQFKGGDQTD
ncbi:hypothetical protein RHSIM_Rhsim11G0105600 [Rhododendron simsii]|uniref:Anaphase-promoting complex subunit 11 n=1 Tax=Rhododendron simsii TaxID=118357 RepID=A0A834G6A7_RHOSS|nr:hypothetical protein RHSIM_Rhsim11G0105600 [Rhododendron simsii]